MISSSLVSQKYLFFAFFIGNFDAIFVLIDVLEFEDGANFAARNREDFGVASKKEESLEKVQSGENWAEGKFVFKSVSSSDSFVESAKLIWVADKFELKPIKYYYFCK